MKHWNITTLIVIGIIGIPLLTLAHIGEHEGETVILIFDDGYEPKNVTIPQGTKVIFENVGSFDHWPATNIHPTHTIYPNSGIDSCGTNQGDVMFDSCRGIPPGGSYNFLFHHEGTWRYHDHLNTHNGGKIIVEAVTGYEIPKIQKEIVQTEEQ
jgi:plastocyanin